MQIYFVTSFLKKKKEIKIIEKTKQFKKKQTPKNNNLVQKNSDQKNMYFIISINPNKHSARIVGHTSSLEKAIELVVEHANEYVNYKNKPVMHRVLDNISDGEKQTPTRDRVIFYSQKSPHHDYYVDVFEQKSIATRGWTGTTFRDEQQLVRRFCYTEYALIPEAPAAPVLPTNVPINPLDVEQKHKMKMKQKLISAKAVAGFPVDVIQSLQECEMFQQNRIAAEMNRLPPPMKCTTFSNNESDSESSD